MPQAFRIEPHNAGLPNTGCSVWWPSCASGGGSRGAPRRFDRAQSSYRRTCSAKAAPATGRAIPAGAAVVEGPGREGSQLRHRFQHRPRFGADLITLSHEGTKVYSNTFELVHRREAAGPNAIWQADHTPLDILLIRPDGETAKPWLSDRRLQPGCGRIFFSFQDPSALHTSLALRQAIWRKEDARWVVCGIPDGQRQRLHIQSPGTSRCGSEDPAGLFHSRQTEGPWPRRAVLRNRERDVLVRVGWLRSGWRRCARKANADAGRVRHEVPRLLARRVPPRENAQTKTPPVERWEANGFLPRMPDSLEQLNPLLIQVAKTRQVRVDGIHFQSLRYISTTLAAYLGETVTLRFDPRGARKATRSRPPAQVIQKRLATP